MPPYSLKHTVHLAKLSVCQAAHVSFPIRPIFSKDTAVLGLSNYICRVFS